MDRANGHDNPPQNTRPVRGVDGQHDPKVNRPLMRNEFDENLNSLKNNRACGSDGIKNELLKNRSDKFKDLPFHNYYRKANHRSYPGGDK